MSQENDTSAEIAVLDVELIEAIDTGPEETERQGWALLGAWTVSYAVRTDVGAVRDHNEDNFLAYPEGGVFSVIDGMGGHAAGDVAARIAAETIEVFFKSEQDIDVPFDELDGDNDGERELSAALKLASLRIFQTAEQNPDQEGMGATCVAITIRGDDLHLGHVGDSRVYRYRDGELTQLTVDHSLLNEFLNRKNYTPEQVEQIKAKFEYKNVITRSIGGRPDVEVEVGTDVPADGDIYMLCSDGITGGVSDAEICQILEGASSDLSKSCEQLVERANQEDGSDNATVMLVKIEGF